MLYAAFALANNYPLLDEVVEEPVMNEEDQTLPEDTPVIRQPFFAPKPERVHTNMNKTTFSQYQDVLQAVSLEPIAPPPPTPAEEFVFVALFDPSIIHVAMLDYPETVMDVGQIVKHLWHDEQCVRFIQYATICTPYGNIYITCELNPNGDLTDPATPVNVNYDSIELRERVASAARIHHYRFGRAEKFNPDLIQSHSSLHFFLGTVGVEENVVQYLV